MKRDWVHAIQAAKAVLWSGLAVGLILLVDRGCFPESKTGWREVPSLAEIPVQAHFEGMPAYLPDAVRWPPERIFFRENPAGWWYGLADAGSSRTANEAAISVWLGEGEAPLPHVLAAFSECMDVVRGHRCPDGWHYFSTRLRSGRMLMLLTRLAPVEGKRILNALEQNAP